MAMDRQIEPKKGIRPKHIGIGVAVIGLIFFVVKMVMGAESTYRVSADNITLGQADSSSFKEYITLTGTVEPLTTIYLDAEEGGKVEAIVVEEGEMVNAGDVILKLSNSDLNLSLLSVESNLAYSSNELRNTMINLDRQRIANKQEQLAIAKEVNQKQRTYEQNKRLFEKGYVSREDYDRSKEEYELAVNEQELKRQRMIQDSVFRINQQQQMDQNLGNMQKNLSLARGRLDNLNVKSPVKGQLGTLNAEMGQLINKGERIGQIHILDEFKVSAQVDEHYIDRVKSDLRAVFERQDKEFELKVHKVYPEVRDGRFKVDMAFDAIKPDNLRTGQTYNLRLELGQPVRALLIPRGNFFQSTGGQWIFVVDASGKYATRRNIRIGRQNPLYFEVLEGLLPDEKVIVSGYEMFGNNEKIEFE